MLNHLMPIRYSLGKFKPKGHQSISAYATCVHELVGRDIAGSLPMPKIHEVVYKEYINYFLGFGDPATLSAATRINDRVAEHLKDKSVNRGGLPMPVEAIWLDISSILERLAKAYEAERPTNWVGVPYILFKGTLSKNLAVALAEVAEVDLGGDYSLAVWIRNGAVECFSPQDVKNNA